MFTSTATMTNLESTVHEENIGMCNIYGSKENEENNNESMFVSAASNLNGVVSSTRVSMTRATNVLGSFLPSASSISNLTTRKYTLPEKSVASQILMYRQLLHTECRSGLRLSRKFQGTQAQRAVMHMPWWEQGVEQTGRMVISYDNLITRLWLHGAILPYATSSSSSSMLLSLDDIASTSIDTLLTSEGLPPFPHEYWTTRLGFQQDDPVTDFRSGGVLSLAMLVHIVEACPHVHRRFLTGGDAEMLPYGITSINITDMLAKFLMFSKSVDKVDALMTSKPFWRAFSDPNSLLLLQELSMDMLCDVVVELGTERRFESTTRDSKITVFDFPMLMETIEKRMRDDLLNAGPKTTQDLRRIANQLRTKYSQALDKRILAKKNQINEAPSYFQVPLKTNFLSLDVNRWKQKPDDNSKNIKNNSKKSDTHDFLDDRIDSQEEEEQWNGTPVLKPNTNTSIPDLLC